MLRKILKEIEELFFPIECIICKQEGTFLCPSCEDKILFLETESDNQKLDFLDDVYILSNYSDAVIKKLIWDLKYNFNKDLASIAGRLIYKKYNQVFKKESCFISVPLYKDKLKKRGFNQSELIAKDLAFRLGLKYIENVLCKKRHTDSQMELSKEARLKNLADAFEVRRDISGQDIYLLDDVLTTGTTLNECAKVLKMAGAKHVWGVVLAKD